MTSNHTRPVDHSPLDMLLRQLRAAGVTPRRHGRFLGFLRPDRLTPALWRLARRHEEELLGMLPDSPTPHEVWRQRGAA